MRVFVALPLPEEARRKALRLQQALRERVDPAGRLGRLVREENLHLTLAFIGEVPEASARRIAAAMREISPERIAWQLTRIGEFGDRSIWAGMERPESTQSLARIERMGRRVRSRLVELGAAHDERPLRPHVTIARGWRGPRREEIERALTDILLEARTDEADEAPAQAALFESWRDAAGAVRYRVVDGSGPHLR